jgi:hypothetical protein
MATILSDDERAEVERELSELKPDATPEAPLREPGEKREDGKRTPKAPRRKSKPDSLEQPIKQMLVTIGGVWHITEASRQHPDPTCASVLVQQAPAIAKTLNAVAMDDESVYRWLSAMMTGGGWGAVAFATLPVVQAIVGAHVVPAIERRRAYIQQEAEEWSQENERGPESPPTT